MYKDITEFFQKLLEQSGSYDIAHAEFWHQIEDDQILDEMYTDWCEANGYSKRNGFDRFCQDHFERRNEIWNTLSNDYDEY